MLKNRSEQNNELSEYMRPRELAFRWQVSRSSVDRIVRKAGLTALYLGDGKTSAVRYSREEVIAYERTRQISLRE